MNFNLVSIDAILMHSYGNDLAEHFVGPIVRMRC